MAGRWAMFLESKPWEGSRSLHIQRRVGDGVNNATYFVESMKLTSVDDPVTPVLTESYRDLNGDVTGLLQAALDLAWEIGLRPAGFEDHKSEVTAVRAHLEDMRTLALKPQGKA